MMGQITKLKGNWEMRKKKLPWGMMKGFNLADLPVKGRLWWDQYEKMFPEATVANPLNEMRPSKELLVFPTIGGKTGDMLTMCTKQWEIHGVHYLAGETK